MAFLWVPTVVFFLINFAQAQYHSSRSTNVATYWGQGPNQQRLLHFCQQSTIDIIPIGFVNFFPAQGNGWPGTNFGNQCSGTVYSAPGNNPSQNELLSSCPDLVADIPVCQNQYGKKIILSLGGGIHTYDLTGADNGTAFADFLWGAFGPQKSSWLKKGLPRPFDGPNNTEVTVDGFDFDIEFPSSDNQAGYIAMIKRLRSLFNTTSKGYLITGAPQCVVPDANMGQMIKEAKFDIIWVQYYNTPQCSARNWVTANPNYLSTGVEQPSGFTFDAWEQFLVGTESKNAKLWIGLPASTTAAGSSYYLSPTEATSLIKAYFCKPNFGGIMLWEATAAENNDLGCGETYYEAIKEILLETADDGTLECVDDGKTPKTTSKASCTVTTTKSTSTTAGPTPTPTPPCTEVYVVQPGDYCYLIWTEFGITEAQLRSWNPFLDSACSLQIGDVLCVSQSPLSTGTKPTSTVSSTIRVSTTKTSTTGSPTPTTCTEHYTVQSGDYCYLIWTEFGLTEAQFRAYNPSLDAACSLQIGQVLCVSETPLTSSTKTSTSVSKTSSTTSPTPTACTKYYTVQSGDYCYLIYTGFGITQAQLYAYNPTLDANCDLQIGQILCVSESPVTSSSTSKTSTKTSSTKTTTSVPTSSPTACTKYYTVQSGDYCYLIYTEFGISEAQLRAYNPSLDSNCDLQVGQVLCVSVSPQTSKTSSSTKTSSTSKSSSTVKTTSTTKSTSKTSTTSPTPTALCTKFYTVQSGDYCYLIWTEFGITQAQLYAYNPSLDSNCDLQVGQVLCVSEAPASTTLRTSTTSKSSSKSSSTLKTTTSSSKSSSSSKTTSTSHSSTSSSKTSSKPSSTTSSKKSTTSSTLKTTSSSVKTTSSSSSKKPTTTSSSVKTTSSSSSKKSTSTSSLKTTSSTKTSSTSSSSKRTTTTSSSSSSSSTHASTTSKKA